MQDIINYVKEWNLETSKTGLDNLLDSREQEGRSAGIKIGHKEGRDYGIKIGRNDGIKIGRTEGRLEAKLTIAKNMLNKNMSIEDIASFTGLSKKQILSLQ